MSKCEAGSIRFTEGSSVKALGDGLYEALAVALGDEPDCDNEVFCQSMSEEDFDLDRQKYLKLLFAHGQDPTVGKRRLAKADFKFLPRVGVKILWRFEQPFDPVVRDIINLCDEGGMAISSAAILSEKRKETGFIRIIRWPIHEVSLTSSACAISGRTRVTTSKDFESLSFDELMRQRGLSEWQLMRERSAVLRHNALATLDRKCNGPCPRCDHTDEWIQDQRRKIIRYNADAPERIQQRDIQITAAEAIAKLHSAEQLLAKTHRFAAEVEAEHKRLGLRGGPVFRSVEDWAEAGRRSFGCGFLTPER